MQESCVAQSFVYMHLFSLGSDGTHGTTGGEG